MEGLPRLGSSSVAIQRTGAGGRGLRSGLRAGRHLLGQRPRLCGSIAACRGRGFFAGNVGVGEVNLDVGRGLTIRRWVRICGCICGREVVRAVKADTAEPSRRERERERKREREDNRKVMVLLLGFSFFSSSSEFSVSTTA